MFEAIVKRGILVTVAFLIIGILGLVAAGRLPVQMIPDLDVRTISIRTQWPGATPQDVEKEIVVEQEEYLRTLPNLSRIVSSAVGGVAEIELEFPFGTDITELLIRVNNALSQVPSYPEAVDEPVIVASSFSSNSFMFIHIGPLEGNPRQVDLNLLKDYIEDKVRPRLTRVDGISDVQVSTSAARQIQVRIDPARLAQRGLSLSDVRNAIRARNRDRSGGDLEDGKRQYLIRTIGRFESLADLEALILARRDDTIIRLSDVAEVKLHHFEIYRRGSFNGEQSIQLYLQREPGSNVIDTKNAVMAALDTLNTEVLAPDGLRAVHIANDALYVEQSVRNVWQNLSIGTLFAILVMYVFVRSARTTLIGVMGIPICIIIAFLGMLLAGRTINVISLTGIAFAIGMTLDNSIVVLESIELFRRQGQDRLSAAANGVRAVWPAVLASTLTTVLVFVPITFIDLEAGQLYGDIAIAISAAIVASMAVAIIALPTAAARIELTQAQPAVSALAVRTKDGVLRVLSAILTSGKRQWLTVLGACVVSGAILAGLTPEAEYLPEGEEPKIFGRVISPPGYNTDTMMDTLRSIEDRLLPHVGEDPAAFHRGEAAFPALKYLNISAYPKLVFMVTEPVDTDDIPATMNALDTLFTTFPGMRAFVSRGSIITSNEGGTRSINLDISGPDLATIFAVADAAYRRAMTVFDHPRIQSTPSSLSLDQPMVEIRPDWTRAAQAGFQGTDLGYTIAALTDGTFADEFFLGDDKIDIYLHSNTEATESLDSLPQLPLYTPQGTVLPLSAIAEIVETADTDSIRRLNGNRTVSLNIIPPPEIPLERGVEMVKREVITHLRDRGSIPANVGIDISGAADQLDATREALSDNYLIALLIIYLVLAAIFNHWGYPLLIMTTIPLGIAGGVFGLWLFNLVGSLTPLLGVGAFSQSFDMISMLGFLILMGTVVNNPILIVDRSISNARTQQMTAKEAVIEAVQTRMRPIAMSTITTLAGIAPLVFIPGAGVELYRGVGIIVMFGIIGATVVSLTVLPALTVIALEWEQRWQRI